MLQKFDEKGRFLIKSYFEMLENINKHTVSFFILHIDKKNKVWNFPHFFTLFHTAKKRLIL
jgi:hypothetical protein